MNELSQLTKRDKTNDNTGNFQKKPSQSDILQGNVELLNIKQLLEISENPPKSTASTFNWNNLDKTGSEEKIHAQYQKIIKAYNNNPAELKRKTQIGPNTLQKIIGKALCFFENQKNKINKDKKKNKESFIFEYKDVLFSAKISENLESENLELVVLKNKVMKQEKIIGMGKHAIIYKSIRMKQDKEKEDVSEELAFKMARTSFVEELSSKKFESEEARSIYIRKKQKKCSERIEMDYQVLRKLHELNPYKNKPRGIPPAPYQVIQYKKDQGSSIEENQAPPIFGYITKLYDGDLLICYGYSPLKKLPLVLDILSGLAYMEKINYVHGDIKAENVVVKKESDGTMTTHICDFDDAKELDSLNGFFSIDEKNKKTFGIGTHTPACCSKKLLLEASGAWKLKDIKKSNQRVLDNNVFGAGILLYEFLSGEPHSFPSDGMGYVLDIKNFDRTPLSKKRVPEKLISLIEKILTAQPGKMMSMRKIFKLAEKIINSKKHFQTL